MGNAQKSAHQLARQVAAVTGESTEEAVRVALIERLERLRAEPSDGLARRMILIGGDIRKKYDVREPITPKEWDDL